MIKVDYKVESTSIYSRHINTRIVIALLLYITSIIITIKPLSLHGKINYYICNELKKKIGETHTHTGRQVTKKRIFTSLWWV